MFQVDVTQMWYVVSVTWAVAGSLPTRLPQREQSLSWLIPPAGAMKQMACVEAHDRCTIDFCEYLQRDSTWVAQLHMSPSCINHPCGRLQDLFPRDKLEAAANAGNPTVWKLDGKSMIEPPQRFMAISHVWSDGTGAGAWPEGEVNKCLYTFFREIAEQFQCEGIWWDTICIPKEKGARSKAINKIQSNYKYAQITLVHDCFLRNCEWVDPATACFAIIMSPWFSRGWTLLELAKSQKVKVVFKGSYGPLIKDLDEDILAKDDCPPGHKIATEVMFNLRRGITGINELKVVLGPRHTSKPRDIAVISGRLVGIQIPPNASQQDIYQEILRKMARVSHEHLFHNSATTMSKGFSWCPTSLLDMPLASLPATLLVEENGAVVGTWKVFGLDSIPEEKYVWKDIPLSIKATLDLARIPKNKDKHVLLVEPAAESITRALIVKLMRTKEKTLMGFHYQVHCSFVGSVYCHPPQELGKENKRWIQVEVRIGDPEDMVEIEKKAWDYMSEVEKAIVKPNHPDDVETGERERQMGLGKTYSNSRESNASIMTPLPAEGKGEEKDVQLLPGSGDGRNSLNLYLLSAAVDGDERKVRQLLWEGANPDFQEDKYTWTVLHHATWFGHYQVVQKLIERGVNKSLQDRLGQQALHLAAELGNEKIVRLLLEGANLNVQCKYDNQTVLHRAALGGSKAVVKLLLEKSDPDVLDKNKKTALHIAAEKGYTSVVELLLEKAEPNIQDLMEQTALHLAAQNVHEAIVMLLLKKGTKLETRDNNGRTPLSRAAEKGCEAVVKLLLEGGAELETEDNNGRTPLWWAAANGCEAVVKLLLEGGAEPESKDAYGLTPLSRAVSYGHEAVVRLLLENGAGAQGGCRHEG